MADVISGSLLLDLLPQDLRGELCIADIVLRGLGRSVTFRMEPGRSFEQRGIIADIGGDWYRVSIAERYRPGDPLTDITGTYGMSGEEVPDELRGAACRAWTRGISRPHWRDALGAVAPKVLSAWPSTTATRAMTPATAKIARDSGSTCFLCLYGDRAECLTAPPRDHLAYLSVTPEGAWSVHHGADTYPVSGHPDAGAFAGIRSDAPIEPQRLQIVRDVSPQVRAAHHDSFGIGPPTRAQAERGPTWTSDEARRTQGTGRGR